LRKLATVVLTAVLYCAPSGSLAQEDDAPIAPADEATAPFAAEAEAEAFERTITVPALTELAIEIMADLGSNTSKQHDVFPLRLAAPIVIDGVEVVSAGTPGMGEVIHAKKSGGGGVGGELILAARYLEVGDRQLPLRSLRVDPTVKDRIGTVQAINVASAAFVPALSVVGFLIKGDQLSIPTGSILAAKTGADFEFEIPSIADASPVEAAPFEITAGTTEISSATGGEIQ
jgi:hypothetical protein